MSERVADKLPSIDQESGLFVTTGYAPNDIMKLRADFVRDMGWTKDEDDTDIYDGRDSTFHIAKYSPEGQLIATMRLTKVDSAKDCLSHTMTRGLKEMYAAIDNKTADIDESAAGDGIWDLTRLVHPLDGSVSTRDIVFAITDMIGVAIAKTSDEKQGENLTWVYTTTPAIKHTLDGLGIVGEVIAKGRISPEDEYESYFCTIKPFAALKYANEHPGQALRGALNGLAAADRI